MPRVIWADAVSPGFLKTFLFLEEFDADAAEKAVQVVLSGVKNLGKIPNAGRPADDLEPEQKELVLRRSMWNS